jgi:hypothetical protein
MGVVVEDNGCPLFSPFLAIDNALSSQPSQILAGGSLERTGRYELDRARLQMRQADCRRCFSRNSTAQVT